jgi:hypothetical protein
LNATVLELLLPTVAFLQNRRDLPPQLKYCKELPDFVFMLHLTANKVPSRKKKKEKH